MEGEPHWNIFSVFTCKHKTACKHKTGHSKNIDFCFWVFRLNCFQRKNLCVQMKGRNESSTFLKIPVYVSVLQIIISMHIVNTLCVYDKYKHVRFASCWKQLAPSPSFCLLGPVCWCCVLRPACLFQTAFKFALCSLQCVVLFSVTFSIYSTARTLVWVKLSLLSYTYLAHYCVWIVCLECCWPQHSHKLFWPSF